MNNNKKEVLSGVFWKFLERMGAQLVSFFVSMQIARILPTSDYGIIPLVSVFIAVSSVIVDGGLGLSLIQKKDADDLDFSTVFYFSVLLSIVLYILVFFIAIPVASFYKLPILKPVLRVLALIIIVNAINSVQQAYIARKMLFKKFFYATLIGTIVSGVVGIYMAIKGMGVWALVFQTLTNSIIDTIILQLSIDWRPKKMFSFERLKSLFSYGWKLLVQSLILQSYANIRVLVIGKVYTSDDLAFYSKGNQYPSLISTNVDTAINTAIFPAMSKQQDSLIKVKEMARKTIQLSSYIMSPILIGFSVIAQPLIVLTISDKWLPAIPFLRICCISLLFRAPQTAIIQAVKAVGRSDSVLKIDIPIRLFSLLILVISLRYGVLAFAISEILITVVGTILYIIMSKRILKYGFIEVLHDFCINILLSLVMGGAVFFVGHLINVNLVVDLLLQVFTGVSIYILLSLITRNSSFKFLVDALKEMKRKSGDQNEKRVN